MLLTAKQIKKYRWGLVRRMSSTSSCGRSQTRHASQRPTYADTVCRPQTLDYAKAHGVRLEQSAKYPNPLLFLDL
jgi:hypothetical protein